MSDRRDTLDELPHYRPDRAIEQAMEDQLHRDPFVTRLARALVREDHKASGVVIGLTGAWGSGKSSILNLLKLEIESKHEGAVVIRFDPWLVSGRDDVITQFFAELLATIKTVGTRNPQVRKVVAQLTGRLTKYAANLAPSTALAGYPMPGLREAMKAVGEALDRTESLADQRADLKTSLEGVGVPIIVLVDELDRIEDAEVLAVAQLVRAVADFPGISYLLAYDRARVVQALGGGDTDRGSHYLEKIVQLEIRIPNSLPNEIRWVLDEALEQIARQSVLPETWREEARFTALREIIIPGVLSTPRDLRRVAGKFSILIEMVGREVDWVDLLAYCVLLAKVPHVVDAMQRRPQDFTIDYPGTDWVRWPGGSERGPEEHLKAFDIPPDSSEAKLLAFLFPCFSKREVDDDDEILLGRGLRTLDGLNTVLRLGLLPGEIPLNNFEEFLQKEIDERQKDLVILTENNTFDLFFNGLAHAYHALNDPYPLETFLMFMQCPAPERFELRQSYYKLHENVRGLHRFIFRSVRRKPNLNSVVANAIEKLLADKQIEIPARLLSIESKKHGLDSDVDLIVAFGGKSKDKPIIPREEIDRLRKNFTDDIKSSLDDGKLLEIIHTLAPIRFAIEIKYWSDECRAMLTEEVVNDRESLIVFLLVWTNSYNEINFEDIGEIIDINVFCSHLTEIREGMADKFDDLFLIKSALDKVYQALDLYEHSANQMNTERDSK